MTGAPTLVAGRLYVPLSSLEESGAGNPNYPCCTFRGGVIAYDALNGERLWTAYTIPEEPVQLKKTSKGVQLWGPAGAGVWSSPTVDLEAAGRLRRDGQRLHGEPAANSVGRGRRVRSRHRRSAVGSDTGDGGRRRRQGLSRKYRPLVPKDNKSETCPDDLGPDMDFGNAPILRTLPDGRTLIVIGQKDGHAWALDPDRGRGHRVESSGRSSASTTGAAAIMWGSAADDRLGYFPVTRATPTLGCRRRCAWPTAPWPGGRRRLMAARRRRVSMPGVLFFGSSAGTVYACSTTDGRALWQFRGRRASSTLVNGVRGAGRHDQRRRPVVAAGMPVRAVRVLEAWHRRARKRAARFAPARAGAMRGCSPGLTSTQRTPRTRRSEIIALCPVSSWCRVRTGYRITGVATPRARRCSTRRRQRRADERPFFHARFRRCRRRRGGTADDQRALLPRSMPPLGR